MGLNDIQNHLPSHTNNAPLTFDHFLEENETLETCDALSQYSNHDHSEQNVTLAEIAAQLGLKQNGLFCYLFYRPLKGLKSPNMTSLQKISSH